MCSRSRSRGWCLQPLSALVLVDFLHRERSPAKEPENRLVESGHVIFRGFHCCQSRLQLFLCAPRHGCVRVRAQTGAARVSHVAAGAGMDQAKRKDGDKLRQAPAPGGASAMEGMAPKAVRSCRTNNVAVLASGNEFAHPVQGHASCVHSHQPRRP